MKGKFLLVRYVSRPRNPNLSHVPNAGIVNMQTDEQIKLLYEVKDKDILNSNLILDLNNKKVIRTSRDIGRDYDKIFKYYNLHYHKQLNEFLDEEKDG